MPESITIQVTPESRRLMRVAALVSKMEGHSRILRKLRQNLKDENEPKSLRAATDLEFSAKEISTLLRDLLSGSDGTGI